MGRGPPVSEEEIGSIKAFKEVGLTLRAIARRTGRSTDTIRRVLGLGKPQSTRKRGRKPKLTLRETRLVVRTANSGNYSASQLRHKFSLSCSTRTVRRILARVDHLVYTKMERTLGLSKKHRDARLVWVADMLAKHQGNWDKTIFSDEKKFNLDGPDGYKYYWRDLRRPPREYVTRQHGGGSVMVWAAFSAKGKSEIAFLSGRQASKHYIWTLCEFLYPFAHLMHGTEFFFQQDNASIHTSRETRQFFEEMELNVIDWPARSPDLNPIENVWNLLSAKVYQNGRQYESVADLKEAIKREWETITVAELKNLVDSMNRRCFEVIRLGGGKTHY